MVCSLDIKSKSSKIAAGCLWITGLSAAGKTTVSRLVRNQLILHSNNVVLLDGDQLRSILALSDVSFDRNARLNACMIYSRMVRELVNQGLFVIIAVIGLYQEVHQWNRAHIDNYYDVYLDVPIDELIKRDPKGLYKRYIKREISNVSGLDLQVDIPTTPWMHVVWQKNHTPDMTCSAIIERLLLTIQTIND